MRALRGTNGDLRSSDGLGEAEPIGVEDSGCEVVAHNDASGQVDCEDSGRVDAMGAVDESRLEDCDGGDEGCEDSG